MSQKHQREAISSIPAFGIVSGKIIETHLCPDSYVQVKGVYAWGDEKISGITFDFPDSHLAAISIRNPNMAVAICIKPNNQRVGKIVPSHLKMMFTN